MICYSGAYLPDVAYYPYQNIELLQFCPEIVISPPGLLDIHLTAL